MSRFHKNKLPYLIKNYPSLIVPRAVWHLFKPDFEKKLAKRADRDDIMERVAYYEKVAGSFKLEENVQKLSEYTLKNSKSAYLLDLWHVARWFPGELRCATAFGDINKEVPIPSITKSRPIAKNGTSNNVILKLNKFRHFQFLNDPYRFADKSNNSIFRADIGDPDKANRVIFMEKWFGSDICNCGSIRNMEGGGLPEEWITPKTPIEEHLKYKFILTLEGNDVATNLKWVMSSNSVAVMPEPTCETWYMEGRLKPDYHYIKIADDFSDLETRLNYFINHPKEAEQIIKNAHRYVENFLDEEKEEIIEYFTLQSYFKKSGQM